VSVSPPPPRPAAQIPLEPRFQIGQLFLNAERGETPIISVSQFIQKVPALKPAIGLAYRQLGYDRLEVVCILHNSGVWRAHAYQ
jgi:hypothetical protein